MLLLVVVSSGLISLAVILFAPSMVGFTLMIGAACWWCLWLERHPELPAKEPYRVVVDSWDLDPAMDEAPV